MSSAVGVVQIRQMKERIHCLGCMLKAGDSLSFYCYCFNLGNAVDLHVGICTPQKIWVDL